MRRLVVGVLAHVDAGKTTLSEAMLYHSGVLQTVGRVDHKNAFLDTHSLERARGITIFSKQARFSYKEMSVTLVDTPGHVDFSAEAERTLQTLDCAVLVVSGTDGVQAHTETMWRLLERYGIPTFIFVNKMDQEGNDRARCLQKLKADLGENCVDFGADGSDAFYEELALCDERALELYTESGSLPDDEVTHLIASRKLFPCWFGSALHLDGVEALLDGLARYAPSPVWPEEFGARVYKISRDAQGTRLTWLKVTGGRLQVRSVLSYTPAGQQAAVQAKVNQIRLYSGDRFEQVDAAMAGDLCAVTGPADTWPGQCLGAETGAPAPSLEPVLSYRVLLPQNCDARTALPKLQQLAEEDPTLHVVWSDQLGEIHIRLMGEVQTQILTSIIQERFGLDVAFDDGSIIYRETIAAPVEGVGHFEPLRHYAEVHLLLEPLPRDSGLVFTADCPPNSLDENWQRLVLTHLAEKTHLGVLTGSPITDMRITLKSGRAHLKHTEGGDFRQSTYRAVRQGLMRAESVLLEPCYSFRLEVPTEQVGRAISDLRAMSASFSPPRVLSEERSLVQGRAPVAQMRNYMTQVTAYTRGRGSLGLSPGGYAECVNAQSVIDSFAYDPCADLENTPDSVFCAHGAGFVVPWDKVPEYMHLESVLRPVREDSAPASSAAPPPPRSTSIDEKELEAIMQREFGPIRRPIYGDAATVNGSRIQLAAPPAPKETYYIVDGYNLLFAWEELEKLAKEDIDAARHRLMDLLAGYQAFRSCQVVLVFDGYKVKGNTGTRLEHHGINVVYTKEGETGDMYMEKLVHDIGRNESVRVVTSDNLIRLSALGAGVLRISANEFREDVLAAMDQIDAFIKEHLRRTPPNRPLEGRLDPSGGGTH